MESIEAGTLEPGISTKLANIDLAFSPKLSFQIGQFVWTKLKVVNPDQNRKSYVELFYEDAVNPGLVLAVSAKEGKTHSVEVDIYSRGALIDTTGTYAIYYCTVMLNSPFV